MLGVTCYSERCNVGTCFVRPMFLYPSCSDPCFCALSPPQAMMPSYRIRRAKQVRSQRRQSGAAMALGSAATRRGSNMRECVCARVCVCPVCMYVWLCARACVCVCPVCVCVLLCVCVCVCVCPVCVCVQCGCGCLVVFVCVHVWLAVCVCMCVCVFG